jgi:peptidoglycan/LPS O-acetylase OafA/YrhL
MQTNRNNVGALIGGAVLIGIGLLTLVSRMYTGIDWGLLWPFSIIGFGALFFIAMFAMGKSGAAFAIPGTIITGIGLVVLFQNITQHWTTMSYLWTLIIIFVGLGIYLMGWYGEDANQKRSGGKVMKIGIILFIIFGTIFETVFSSLNNAIFPILLILLGVYLVLSRSGLLSRKQNESTDAPLPPTS